MLIQLLNDSIKLVDSVLLAKELAVFLQPILLPVDLKAAHEAFRRCGSHGQAECGSSVDACNRMTAA